MLASPLPPSFLDISSLSTSYLECNAFCMVVCFRVPWSIISNSSLVHFKYRPEYLKMETAPVFVPLISFLRHSSVSFNSLVLLKYFYYYKFYSSGRDLVICLYPEIPKEFQRLILHDLIWVLHIPFVRMINLKCLARFTVNHFAQPVLFSLILFLC